MPWQQSPTQRKSIKSPSVTEDIPPQESSSPSASSSVAQKPKDAVALSREALAILQHRMLTEPEDIPSGALLKFMETLAKLELARLANTAPDKPDEDQSVAQIVVAAQGLPPARQREILLAQRGRSQADVQLVDVALAALDAPQEGT